MILFEDKTPAACYAQKTLSASSTKKSVWMIIMIRQPATALITVNGETSTTPVINMHLAYTHTPRHTSLAPNVPQDLEVRIAMSDRVRVKVKVKVKGSFWLQCHRENSSETAEAVPYN